MIQKIRSYLLDNEDHKDSIGWYAAIIILAPLLGIFFQYRKQNSIYMGSVNGKKIEKSVFNIKLYEQSSLVENIKRMFGEDQAEYFFDMLFQGKGMEEYVLSSEIKRIFLQGLFEKIISNDVISENFILFNIKNKSLDKIKKNVGELPFLLITQQIKPSDVQALNVDMGKIDLYCQEVFQVNLLKDLFFVPLSTIEKLVLFEYPSLPIRVNYRTYSFLLDQDDYRKNIKPEVILDNELRAKYDLDLKKNKHKKDKIITFSISAFCLKELEKKDVLDKSKIDKSKKEDLNKVNKNEEIEKKWKILSSGEKKNTLVNIKDILNKNFSFLKGEIYNDCKITFKDNNEKQVVSSSLASLSNILREKIKNEAVKNKENFFTVILDDKIYLVENCLISAGGFVSFEESKSIIIKSIIEERAGQLLDQDIDKIRYSLEKNSDDVVLSGWKKNTVIFNKDRNKDNNKKSISDFDLEVEKLTSEKLSSGGLRKGTTFILKKADEFIIFYVEDMTYEDEKQNFKTRKDGLYNKEFFVESLENNAKIEINND
jgi:hypothetical protein